VIAWPFTSWPTRAWPQSAWPDNAAHHQVLARSARDAEDVLLAALPPTWTGAALILGEPGTVRYVWVRAIGPLGVPDADPVAPRLVRVEFDAQGMLVLPAPNAPVGLHLRLLAQGHVEARWTYLAAHEAASPALFRVYVALDDDPMDFEQVSHEVPMIGGSGGSGGSGAAGRLWTLALGQFEHGRTVRVVVRSVAAHGADPVYAEETNTEEAEAVADAQAPDQPQDVLVEVTGQ
jgi:hypothetical protein